MTTASAIDRVGEEMQLTGAPRTDDAAAALELYK
jgi:hypothetical protein